jgi:hypothetical protein
MGYEVMKEGKGPRRRPSKSVYPRTEEPLQTSAGVESGSPRYVEIRMAWVWREI